MDQKPAENILRTSIRAVALFNQLVRELQDTLPEDEFEIQRHEIAKIMGSICIDLINSAASRCPSIDIDTPEGWEKAGMLFEPHWLKKLDDESKQPSP